MLQLRDHSGIMGRRDEFQIDPRQLNVDNGFNVRDLDSPEERPALDELKEQIRGVGVQHALIVRMKGDEVFIVSGHRRHKVVMELIEEGEEIKTVPVKHEQKGTGEAERALMLITSNSGKPLSSLQIAEVVRRLVGYGWDHGQIAKRLGWKSKASVGQHLDMLTLPAPVQAAVKRGEIGATLARRTVAEIGAEATEKLIADNAAQKKKTRPRDVAKATGKAKPKTDRLPVPPPRSQASVVEPQATAPAQKPVPDEYLAGIQDHVEQPAEAEAQANGHDATDNCHCGKDGHPLNSIKCPVHGATPVAARVVGEWRHDFNVTLPDAVLGELTRRIATAIAGTAS